jgi:hypothetical protein
VRFDLLSAALPKATEPCREYGISVNQGTKEIFKNKLTIFCTTKK